jgi:hypothetical protein
MFTCHRHSPANELDCPHAIGLTRFHRSEQSFSSLSAATIAVGCLVRTQATNLRVSLVAGPAQFQASGFQVGSHAGGCSPASQRSTKGSLATKEKLRDKKNLSLISTVHLAVHNWLREMTMSSKPPFGPLPIRLASGLPGARCWFRGNEPTKCVRADSQMCQVCAFHTAKIRAGLISATLPPLAQKPMPAGALPPPKSVARCSLHSN